MNSTQLARLDLALSVRRLRGRRLRVAFSFSASDAPGLHRVVVLPFPRPGRPGRIAAALGDLLRDAGLPAALDAQAECSARSWDPFLLKRIVLGIEPLRLHDLPWEEALAPLLDGRGRHVVIRASPVPQRPEIAQCERPARLLVLTGVNAGRPSRLSGLAAPASRIRAAERPLEGVADLVRESGWPAADAILIDGLRGWPGQRARLSASASGVPGTLGWLCRVARVMKTRVVVFDCESAIKARSARVLAAGLVARGGPAAIVLESGRSPAVPCALLALDDFPLDLVVAALPPGRRPAALFGGHGREAPLRRSSAAWPVPSARVERDFDSALEITRTDAGGAALFAIVIRDKRDVEHRKSFHRTEIDIGRSPTNDLMLASGRISKRHARLLYREGKFIVTDQNSANGTYVNNQRIVRPTVVREKDRIAIGEYVLRVEGSERETASAGAAQAQYLPAPPGFLGGGPSLKKPEASPLLPGSGARPSRVETYPITAMTTIASPASTPTNFSMDDDDGDGAGTSRFTNGSLWRAVPGGALARLDPRTASLRPGAPVHLGVQIGPRDPDAPTALAAALPEHVFEWRPDLPGVHVEIGVTGLDFDVAGAPVQELFLPREGPTEFVYFAVTPRRRGAARIRYAVYLRDDLLQSFRLAAWVDEPGAAEAPAAERRASLARALELPEETVGEARYLARLEYSVVSSLDSIEERPRRALSIVANDLDGRPAVTVKAGDVFAVRVDNNLPEYVKNVRAAWSAVTSPAGGAYAFGAPGDLNAGKPEQLKAALRRMAEAGFQLYSALLSAAHRRTLARVLAEPGQILHAAHVHLDRVIPWSAVYAARIDPNRKKSDDGRPVAHDTCLAALPSEEGALGAARCGEHPDCLLHPDRLRQRGEAGQPVHAPDTVVCPLHFWGFKHQIEIPAQQADDRGEVKREERCRIDCTRPAQLVAGIHLGFRFAERHVKELTLLAADPAAGAVWRGQTPDRDELLSLLRAPDLDIIYFYCHARTAPDRFQPYLELSPKGAPAGRITVDELDDEVVWEHGPLVILNGCGTVGFGPEAISPFVARLVQDRGAAAVLGTEVAVFEPLAAELAERFLRAFLGGRTAGEALLLARRALLARHNPLGVIYTLYGPADLALVGRR